MGLMVVDLEGDNLLLPDDSWLLECTVVCIEEEIRGVAG